jgi:glycosyltransferase involved in cell wall biosynthesis
MIVRNEEIMLERCLASIVAIADEIIIVDTGSIDRTIEIAQKFVSKVHHFAWIDDFAAARNYAHSLATCDYICRFDADCTLRDGDMAKLLQIKKNNFGNADLINLSYVEQFESVENNTNPLFQESICFFYRRNIFHWDLPIHEQLIPNNPKLIPKTSSNNDITVLHHRSEINKTWRTKQNLDLLKTNLAKGDGNYDRMLYFYARELYFDQQYNESIVQYQNLLTQKISTSTRDYAIEKIFFALFYSRQNHRITEFQNLIKNNNSPRIVLLTADILCLSDPVAAAKSYKDYIQKPFLHSHCQVEYDIERFQIHPYIQLAKILIHQGDLQNARKNLNKVLLLAVSPATIDRINKLIEYC